MRVGILTYHNAINYGAVLQAVALQNYIKKETDIDVKILDYRSPAVENQYKIAGFCDRGTLKSFILSNITAVFRQKKKRAFSAFVNSNFDLTKQIKSLSDDEVNNVDVVFVGSDQVWNPDCTKGDITYLLNDLDDRIVRIAYAASMGGCGKIEEYQQSYGIDYLSALNKFKSISCREKDAADFLSRKLEKNCEMVIDPVLLYGVDGWYKLLEEKNNEIKQRDDYIFVYNLGNFLKLQKLVSKIEKETGYKVIVVNKDLKGDLMYLKYVNRSNVGPEEFLRLLSNASIVISDSFHATAFSILFRKSFYVVGNSGKNNTNSRMINILKHYGLENRYIDDDIELKKLENKIDFSSAEEILFRDRQFAEKWIERVLYKSIEEK